MSLAERLERLGQTLIAISGSPIPTHIFQTLAEQAPSAIACDYLAVCLKETDHQDCVVACDVLRRLAITAGTTPGENGFAYGLLYAREQQAADAARTAVRELVG